MSDRVLSIQGCARCHGDGHADLAFREFTHPVEVDGEVPFTHWAPCPANGEPILLRVVPVPSREEEK